MRRHPRYLAIALSAALVPLLATCVGKSDRFGAIRAAPPNDGYLLWSPGIDKGYPDQRPRFADVTGDSLADYITVRGPNNARQLYVYTATGDTNAFDSVPVISPAINLGSRSLPYLFADLNGDGRAELVTFRGTPNSAAVVAYQSDTTGRFSIDSTVWSTPLFTGGRLWFADVTGDQRLDYVTVVFNATAVTFQVVVYPNTGQAFSSTPVRSGTFVATEQYQLEPFTVAPITGGKSQLVVVSMSWNGYCPWGRPNCVPEPFDPFIAVYCADSTGLFSTTPASVTRGINRGNLLNRPWGFYDATGDGRADYITIVDSAFGGSYAKPAVVVYPSGAFTQAAGPSYFSSDSVIAGPGIDTGYAGLASGFANVSPLAPGVEFITFRGNPQTPNLFVYLETEGVFDSNQRRNFRFLAIGDPQFWIGPNATKQESTATIMRLLADTMVPGGFRGLVIAGDMTQDGRADEITQFYSYVAGGSRSNFMYEGLGNHDYTGSNSGPLIDSMIRRVRPNQNRRVMRGVPHYSWEWDNVHFVQMNLMPADQDVSQWGCDEFDLDPLRALTFLRQDLQTNVPYGMPVVIVHHYGFDDSISLRNCDPGDGTGPAWWSDAQRSAYWDAISGYNVVAILTGHVHNERANDRWIPWRRPTGRTNGPTSINTFVAGAPLYNQWLVFSANDDSAAVQLVWQKTVTNTIRFSLLPDTSNPAFRR